MEFESGLFLDIVVVFAAAFFGGLGARLFRLQTIAGYLAVGIIIGPPRPGRRGRILGG